MRAVWRGQGASFGPLRTDACRARFPHHSLRPHLNDDIFFGELWSRYDLLSLRVRSLVTITSLGSSILFIEQHSLTGKTVKVFATSGSSGIEPSLAALKKSYPKLQWSGALLMNGASDARIRQWAGK